jgi:outer membrane protein assembly factor BamB
MTMAGAGAAQDWPNWRGPSYNGSSPAADLPVEFSPTKNVKWAAEMPGPSAATPIIWKDSIFLSSTDLKAEQLVALCLDRRTGKVRWRQNVGSGYMPPGAYNKIMLEDRSNYASPSPVTDGKHVVFFYGNGDLVSFTTAGKKLWQRNLQKEFGDFAYQWTFSSSPQLYEGKLVMQILQRDQPAAGGRGRQGAESFLLALDPATGKQVWRVLRHTGARMESREAYSTPIPVVHNGRKELIIAGGDIVTGHDPATGKELWRWGTYNPDHREVWWRLVPSPVVGGGVVMVCAPKRAPVYATKVGGKGDISNAGLVWKSENRSPVTSDVPTPLYYKGNFYVVSDVRKAISCVRPSDGKVLWSTPLPGTQMVWGSPTGADGKVYLINLNGEVFVLNAADGRILATNPMAEGEREIRSTIAVAHGNLFIRTNSKLYCVGK